ncbi:MAG TPA: ATP-binding cassette domain-containing protein [Puia sp.]|nr:ATP-binding cassette domain-containing protein [Puia sp.]
MREKENDTTSALAPGEPGLEEDPMPQPTLPEETPESATDTAPPEPTTDLNVQPKEPEAPSAAGEQPVIMIRGLCKSFKEHDVLRGVDLHVDKGENLVILGKSGTGKSVLIKCLVGLEWPDSGTIDIFGQDISKLKYGEINALRLRVGFLFQNAALYDSMTVRENLGFPLRQHKKSLSPEKKEALIREMLDNVGLLDSIDQLPSKLSGGQSKRIGLARTLILRPEIMLYDEPTTGLDTGTAKEISELICRTRKKYNISSITITHDMACAKMTADRIVMLKDGIVYAEGSYQELERSEDEWIRSFFY